MITLLIATLGVASAANLDGVADECKDVATQLQDDIAAGTSGYSETAQQDYLLNYFAMATTMSPLHSAVPNPAGSGSINLELAAIPFLGCDRRLVLGGTKTEDTNKAPILPRPRLLFSFNELGKVVPYAGIGYVPPVTVFGTRNVIVGIETGFGVQSETGFEWGMRYHATLMKTIAEIATPFTSEDPEELDFYMGSTFGIDAIVGHEFKEGLKPYMAVGFTDASTFFYIGDDAVVGNNESPYASFTGSLGLQWTLDKLDLAGEFYTAPGVIYTGRVRMGFIL